MPKPSFAGAWSSVELQPDAFVPQRFTIGVVIQSPGDRLYFKLLDDFKKFEHLYHDKFSQKSVRELVAYAYEALTKASKAKTAIPEIRFDTQCLSLAVPSYTSGDDQEATVERLYTEVVVMAPSGKREVGKFEFIDTPTARQMVNIRLKEIAKMNFEKIVHSEREGLLLDFDGRKHFLDLNILTAGACGSVTSAAYKTQQKVEINLLKSSRDLTTYARVKKMNNIGLFLLMPPADQIDPKEFKRIEETIDEHEWKLERDGFRVVSHSSPTELARDIYDWALPSI
jgi:hypothetical protein